MTFHAVDTELVARVHAALIADTSASTDPREAARHAVRTLAPLLGHEQQATVVERVVSELAGLGALDGLLADDAVQEVMVNAGHDLWIDRAGLVERVGRLPSGAAEVLLERILSPLGRRLDRRSPMVDARLDDGSRVCAVIPPASPDGPTFTIRRFGSHRFSLRDFASPAVAELLEHTVHARCNVVVSGATSSGKTTLLNALAGCVPAQERLITLEDTVELALQHDHVVRLEARSETADGVPPIGLDALLRTALRLRPDRIIVGEVRGPEAVVLVQAMGTGHDGSLSTVHANDTVDALRRLEVLIMQAAPTWPLVAVRDHLRSSIDVIVQVGRTADGRRTILDVAEMTDETDDPGAHESTGRPWRLRPLVHGSRLLHPLSRSRERRTT